MTSTTVERTMQSAESGVKFMENTWNDEGEGEEGGGGRCWPYRRTGRAGVLLSRPFPPSPSLLDLKSEGSVFYAESGLTHT